MPLSAGAVTASSIGRLGPLADASVNAVNPLTNYGDSRSLLVQNLSSTFALNDAEAYLKFDLSDIEGTIGKAVLRLTPLATGRAVSRLTVGVDLLDDADDGWVEGSGQINSELTGPLTWFNAPYGVGNQVLVSGTRLRAWRPISIDVTSLINQEFNANRIASFALNAVSSVGARRWVQFVSSENSHVALRPMLTITIRPPTDPPPTVAQQATASNLTKTSVELAALGADTDGEANLAYTWSAVSPAGASAPTFSTNGSNAAKHTTATFHQAGTYVFTATITDLRDGLSVRTNPVTVTVAQSLTDIDVTPSSVALQFRATQRFTAQGMDQFGRTISGTLAGLTWSVSGTGTIGAATGVYVAPGATTVDTVTAQAGSLSATATVNVIAPNALGLKDPLLDSLVQSLDVDGSIDRDDMLSIFRSEYVTTNGVLSSADFSDLKAILAHSADLDIPGYVQVLAGDVINGNPANARFQGQTLGNLAVGSTDAQLDKLVSKWFLGADHPATSWGYRTVSGPLFAGAGPSHADEKQGAVGDCYLIASLGAIADSSQDAIRNMFIDNGVDTVTGAQTWTVRFYANGAADYVTVDDTLPTDGRGYLVFNGAGSPASNPKGLWIGLAEKAYAQWNETGKAGRDGRNRYASLEAGWMTDVNAQVLGRKAFSYSLRTSSDQQALVAAVNNDRAVTIGTVWSNSLPYGMIGGHAYNATGYNSTAKTFTLYNPWGTSQPTKALTWTELQRVSDGFVVADASGTTPIVAGGVVGWPRPVIAPRPGGRPWTTIASAATAPSESRESHDALEPRDAVWPRASAVEQRPAAQASLVYSNVIASTAGSDPSTTDLASLRRPHEHFSRIPNEVAALAADMFFETI